MPYCGSDFFAFVILHLSINSLKEQITIIKLCVYMCIYTLKLCKTSPVPLYKSKVPQVQSQSIRIQLRWITFRAAALSMLSSSSCHAIKSVRLCPVQLIYSKLELILTMVCKGMPVDFSFFFYYAFKTSGSNLDGGSLVWGGVPGI